MTLIKSEKLKRLRLWVKALRSGEYKQTRRCLHGSRGGHCCLGVADCLLPGGKSDNSGTIRNYFGYAALEETRLINLNDKGHKNFSYIANWIEKKIIPRVQSEA